MIILDFESRRDYVFGVRGMCRSRALLTRVDRGLGILYSGFPSSLSSHLRATGLIEAHWPGQTTTHAGSPPPSVSGRVGMRRLRHPLAIWKWQTKPGPARTRVSCLDALPTVQQFDDPWGRPVPGRAYEPGATSPKENRMMSDGRGFPRSPYINVKVPAFSGAGAVSVKVLKAPLRSPNRARFVPKASTLVMEPDIVTVPVPFTCTT